MNQPRLLTALACSLLLTACGSRSIGNVIDDQFLEPRVADAIQRSSPDLNNTTSHIVVTAYNGTVLLAGQTPRQELSSLAEQAARREPGAHKVINQLQISAPSSYAARTNDSGITSRVKAVMVADNTIPSSKIKVVTENGQVFLMGLVTRAEAARAADAARSVTGVQRVVIACDYTD